MGTITGLPIETSTIPELDAYGSVVDAAKGKDLIELAKNSGTAESPVYAAGDSVKSTIDEFKERYGLGGQPRFFEKYDKYELVYSSMSLLADGAYKTFEITPAMHGYYLQMHVTYNIPTLNYSNIAWQFDFTGTFPDGFCVRIQPLAIGGSKTNITDFYLTSGKAYDFVYNLEMDYWTVDELQNISSQDNGFLPQYSGDSNNIIALTNSNYTYLFKIGSWEATSRSFVLLPTSLWRGRYIKIFIDRDSPNSTGFGPFFYPTPYSVATGANDYTATYLPAFVEYKRGQIVWMKILADSTGLVTLDAGLGAKKVYISGVQAGSGDLLGESGGISGIYELSYDPDLDSANGGWNYVKDIEQPDTIEGDTFWRFPYGVSGIKRGSYVVFESEGFGSIKIVDMNIII